MRVLLYANHLINQLEANGIFNIPQAIETMPLATADIDNIPLPESL